MPFDLVATLRTYDGKHVDPFQRAAAQLEPTARTLNRLCAVASGAESPVEIGATWVLKHFLENGASPTAASAEALVALLDSAEQPESLLHLLQSLPYVVIPDALESRLHESLDRLLASENKFVRAWAYNGFAVLAAKNPRYRDETLALFEEALESEAASVKARIRNAKKTL